MKGEKYWEDLGRRAVACEGWQPMAGMLGIRDAKRLRADLACDGDKTRISHTYEGGVLFSTLGFVPDFRDPATVGCLLALVREAWDIDVLTEVWAGAGGNHSWVVCFPYLGGHSGEEIVVATYRTEAEALVAALEQVNR